MRYSLLVSASLTALSLQAQSPAASAPITVSSPNGALQVHLSLSPVGTPLYAITLDADTVLSPSPLGMKTSLGDFTRGLSLQQVGEVSTVSDSYTLANAKKRDFSFTATRQSFAYATADGKPVWEVTFHIDDSNVAFRYELKPQGDRLACLVEEEATAFVLPAGTTTFLSPQMTPQSGFARTAPSYETFYEYDAPMGSNGHGRGFTFPALFREGEKAWVMISETGVDGSYCASRLNYEGGSYRLAYPEAGEFGGIGTSAPGLMLPGVTPWRTITVGRSLRPLAETTIPWDIVEPRYTSEHNYRFGRAAWSWIIRMDASCNFEEQREYIDFAAEMGWEYVLIDALWDTRIGRDGIRLLADYAAERGVGLFLWYNSNGYWNDAPQGPRGLLHRMLDRQREMAWLQEVGIKGMKIDFIGSDKQQTMQLYEDILVDADRYGLMVIFHGCTLQRGWERMFPNFVSCEAVRASENLSFGQYDNDIEALAATIHPVLRNAVGNMDFGGSALNRFYSRDNKRGRERRTSDVYALATAVLFQTPVQNFALAPNNLTDAPAWAIDFMRRVPVEWDDLRFFDGYPGRHVLMARHAADGWYLAGVNAQKEPLKMKLDLSMYAVGQEVLLYLGDNVRTIRVNKKQRLDVVIPANGGVLVAPVR